ncbi:methyltransferase, partial [Actinoalloteichus spitiensis]|uniref:methyltransferase n=1 Tax=Actinoalloteichus spitiensis TaxID=252394 RepID=UPI000380FDE2
AARAAARAVSEAQAESLADGYDFSRYRHLVDVGGGDVALLARVLDRYPDCRATVLGTRPVLAEALEVLDEAGVGQRCAAVEGDCSADLPRGGDGYLLRNVLRGWSDAEVLAVLRRCRAAMDPGGASLLVVTGLVPEWDDDRNPDAGLLSALDDMELMVTGGGRERRLGEYQDLLGAAGLRLHRVVAVPGEVNLHVLEAGPG